MARTRPSWCQIEYLLDWNVTDTSGNSRNGTWTWTPAYTTWQWGKQCATFSWTTHIDSWGVMTWGNSWHDWSVSFWFKSPTNTTDYATMIHHSWWSNSANISIASMANQTIKLWANWETTSTTTNSRDWNWHMVVYTHTTGTNWGKLYIDNNAVVTTTIYNGGNGQYSQLVNAIFRLNWQVWSSNYANAQMQSVRFYNVVLGASDVTNLYSEFSVTTAIKSINGLAKESIKSINWLAIASVKSWNWLS